MVSFPDVVWMKEEFTRLLCMYQKYIIIIITFKEPKYFLHTASIMWWLIGPCCLDVPLLYVNEATRSHTTYGQDDINQQDSDKS